MVRESSGFCSGVKILVNERITSPAMGTRAPMTT